MTIDLDERELVDYWKWTRGEGDYRKFEVQLPDEWKKEHEALTIIADAINSVKNIELSDYQYRVLNVFLPYCVMYVYHRDWSEKQDYIRELYQIPLEDVDKHYIKSISYRQAGKSTIMIIISMAMFLGVPLYEGYEFDQGWISFNLSVVKRAMRLIKSRMMSTPYYKKNFIVEKKFVKDTEQYISVRRKDDPENSKRSIEAFSERVRQLRARMSIMY